MSDPSLTLVEDLTNILGLKSSLNKQTLASCMTLLDNDEVSPEILAKIISDIKTEMKAFSK